MEQQKRACHWLGSGLQYPHETQPFFNVGQKRSLQGYLLEWLLGICNICDYNTYIIYSISHTHVYYRFWVYVIEFPFMLLVGPVGSAVGEVSMLLEDSDSHTLMPTTSELHFNPLGPSDQHLLLPDGFLAPVLPHSLSPQSNLHTAARMTPQSVISIVSLCITRCQRPHILATSYLPLFPQLVHPSHDNFFITPVA